MNEPTEPTVAAALGHLRNGVEMARVPGRNKRETARNELIGRTHMRVMADMLEDMTGVAAVDWVNAAELWSVTAGRPHAAADRGLETLVNAAEVALGGIDALDEIPLALQAARGALQAALAPYGRGARD